MVKCAHSWKYYLIYIRKVSRVRRDLIAQSKIFIDGGECLDIPETVVDDRYYRITRLSMPRARIILVPTINIPS